MARRERRYWLFKTEPDCFGLDHLEREGTSPWDGVRNYQARNHLRDGVGVGDAVLIYYSSITPPGIAGLAEVATAAEPDETAFDPNHDGYDAKSKKEAPRWFKVDVSFRERFPTFLPKPVLAETPGLTEMVLHKSSRLSIQPVTKAEFDIICRLGRKKAGTK